MRYILVAVGTVLSLSGCAGLTVSNLGEPPTVNGESISVVDKRSPEQKLPRRDSALAPLSVLGDKNVQPPAILFLQSSLQKHQKQPASLSIDVEEFYIIDFFPKRLKAATYSGGWLTDAVVTGIIRSNTDWAFVNEIGVPTNGDSVVCLFSGTVNGKKVKVATYEQYHTSPMAVSIRNDSAFTRAVMSAIDKSAKEIISRIEN